MIYPLYQRSGLCFFCGADLPHHLASCGRLGNTEGSYPGGSEARAIADFERQLEAEQMRHRLEVIRITRNARRWRAFFGNLVALAIGVGLYRWWCAL